MIFALLFSTGPLFLIISVQCLNALLAELARNAPLLRFCATAGWKVSVKEKPEQY